jgi:hypothetical protein
MKDSSSHMLQNSTLNELKTFLGFFWVRHETSREKREEMLQDIGMSKNIVDKNPKAQETKGKSRWDFIKIKSFCAVKETVNRGKRKPGEWEKIVVNYTSDKRLKSLLHKDLKKSTAKNPT